ncbi:MAG TPA: hypothetical protein VG269_07035 [Tepidisphaeraceae bacterium]|jgi:hypothetical protein|nr:hypothetical protein [Tepidisphaeraceae bacterium]
MNPNEAPVQKILRVYAAIHAAGAASGRMHVVTRPSRSINGQHLNDIRDVTFQVAAKESDPGETFTLNEVVALMQLIADQSEQAIRAGAAQGSKPTYTTTVELNPSDATIQKVLRDLRTVRPPSPFAG